MRKIWPFKTYLQIWLKKSESAISPFPEQFVLAIALFKNATKKSIEIVFRNSS
jgi:hypothetical protein